ncbi:MAG TPA: aspartate aminotransferase family protein [Bryobacteraceae bacterium]|nr:aspartate aminotransferase family protein [Bryobacteraceae bacterium]
MPASTAAVPSLDKLYADHVNPQWVRLLNVLEMNEQYERCSGSELFTAGGRRVLDFLSGYCVHNTGHNHPAIVAALKDELDRSGPAMLQSHVPALAGQLAERLCSLAGGRLQRAYFCSSGSEGVEAAIKFSRAATGRDGLLYAEHAFHGLTCGALSLMSDDFWRSGFGPLLPGADGVPFGSIERLEEKLVTRQFAAFIVEPIQAEGGICVPDPEYLKEAERLCRRTGTLLVLDEVQTGMYRTGEFLAAHRFGVEPDMVVLAKALSGGLVPVGALLTSAVVSDSVYSSLKRSIVHASTFGENSLAMRAGLATLDVLEQQSLGARASRLGDELRRQLQERLADYEMVKQVRGAGMLSGIEFTTPKRLRLRAAFETFRRIHPGMFGQVLVMRLFRDHGILTQICGNNFLVLKAAPPLVITEAQIAEFVSAVGAVVDLMHSSMSFWTEALSLARRTVNV